MTIHRDTSPDSISVPPGLSLEAARRAGEAATQLPLGPSINAPFIRAAQTHYVYTTQKVVRKVRPTQRDRVLAQLRDGPTCGTEFLEMHIPRYGGRILELRQEGYNITNEKCWKHQHYSRQTIYRLA